MEISLPCLHPLSGISIGTSDLRILQVRVHYIGTCSTKLVFFEWYRRLDYECYQDMTIVGTSIAEWHRIQHDAIPLWPFPHFPLSHYTTSSTCTTYHDHPYYEVFKPILSLDLNEQHHHYCGIHSIFTKTSNVHWTYPGPSHIPPCNPVPPPISQSPPVIKAENTHIHHEHLQCIHLSRIP